MKLLKNVINIATTLVLILTIFITCTFLVSKYILKDSVPNAFGYSVLKVISGSMRSEINVGDFVVIKKTKTYVTGDIVTYIDTDNCVITHRVIEINKEQLTTKGDYNNVEDPIINKDQVFGKVIFIITKNTINLISIIICSILVITTIISLLIKNK